MNRLPRRKIASVVIMLGLTTTAWAGRPCEQGQVDASSFTQALGFAARVHMELEQQYQRGALRVALLARAGQDLRQYGLRYSHVAFAYRTIVSNGTPAWRVVHKLNECGTASAALYRQGLGEFFMDDLWKLEAAWVMLSGELEPKLLAILQNDRAVSGAHEPRYNLVSYPWSVKYQQSNQWAIETLAIAAGAHPSRRDAQRWLHERSYEPTTLHLPTLKRLGGRISSANVAFDDHPTSSRLAGQIQTVTADSVFAWLARAGLAASPLLVVK